MKYKIGKTLLAIILCTGLWGSVSGQTTLLSDDFEAGNLSKWTDADSEWAASTTDPINGSYSLKHNLTGVTGTSILYSSVTATDVNTKVTTWQFNMKNGSWDPSSANYFGIVLMGDESDPESGTFNGYIVGINFDGNTSDLLTLYKVTNGVYTSIISTSFDWDSSDLLGIEVERNSSGLWKLFYDTDGDFDNLTSGGSVSDTDHTTFDYTSVFFDFSTASRAGLLWVDDVLIQQEDETTKAEPTDYPSSFSATGDVKTVNLSWTDASSSPTPDGYLIKANNTGYGDITDPSDTNAESDDTDLSDGTAVLNVLQGSEEASFSGLNELTTYYFKIYPYTNSGSDIDYKTDGTVPQDDATTLETPDIVLNEFLADPDASAGDANNDGSVSSDDDEFIEFVNTGTSDLDISDWTIEDASGTTHTFTNPTVIKPLQAIVVFGGGTPTGDFGGALTQTTSSLGLNNGGDDVILKNDSGVEIINYTYGSEGGNNESITRSPDLTGSYTGHTSVDDSSYSPGTRIDGSTFQPSVEITGSEGWRILSTPTSNNTYADLLDSLWTQGISTGADVTNGSANVQTFDGSQFNAADNLNNSMTSGQGFIVYVYDDQNYDGTDEGFPKRLDLFGTEKTGTVNPTLTSGADAWTLVGNPYNATIDWDDLTPTDLTGTVYVYDHSYGTPSGVDVEASGSAGSYRVWNGTNGSLTDGLIAPFQGFWVQNASSGSPALTIEEADQTTGGTFYKGAENESISIILRGEMENMFSETYLSFTENGTVDKDNYDGLKLSPLDFRPYVSVASVTGNTKLDINNLPATFDSELTIPVSIEAFDTNMEAGAWVNKGGEVTLSWPEMKNIPEEWSITLNDSKSGAVVNMGEIEQYVFDLEDTERAKARPVMSILNPQHPQAERMAKGSDSPRFTVTVSKGEATSTDSKSMPLDYQLEQNYPNPFNPTTSIQYSVANASEVQITIYNVMGQQVATLVNETKSAGTYRVSWNAANMASGIYYYRLEAAGNVITRQMTLIK